MVLVLLTQITLKKYSPRRLRETHGLFGHVKNSSRDSLMSPWSLVSNRKWKIRGQSCIAWPGQSSIINSIGTPSPVALTDHYIYICNIIYILYYNIYINTHTHFIELLFFGRFLSIYILVAQLTILISLIFLAPSWTLVHLAALQIMQIHTTILSPQSMAARFRRICSSFLPWFQIFSNQHKSTLFKTVVQRKHYFSDTCCPLLWQNCLFLSLYSFGVSTTSEHATHFFLFRFIQCKNSDVLQHNWSNCKATSAHERGLAACKNCIGKTKSKLLRLKELSQRQRPPNKFQSAVSDWLGQTHPTKCHELLSYSISVVPLCSLRPALQPFCISQSSACGACI